MKEHVCKSPGNIYIRLIRKVFRFQAALEHETISYDCNYLLIRFTLNISKYMAKTVHVIMYSVFSDGNTKFNIFCFPSHVKR